MKELAALTALGQRMERDSSLMLKVAAEWLQVRDRTGRLQPLQANAAQRAFEARRGRQNIVLKARQMGITTWVAGRFFLRTVTIPGTLSLLVAHTQTAAEGIYAGVDRMWRGLPRDLQQGVLRRGRANAGQMTFPMLESEFRVSSAGDPNAGRGLSVQNLHCSEVSRWPRDARATLAGLRAALAPGGELVLESTPSGAYGCFYEEWCTGVEGGEVSMTAGRFADTSGDGLVKHFLPWWLEPAYVALAARVETMTNEEHGLVERFGLSAEQIGFRRGLERSYGVLRTQEFAEDAESCFRASGACCFDVDAIERRMLETPEAAERGRGGALQVWLPPAAGRRYAVAVDTAGGGAEGDFAAVQVVEVSTGLQCAELQQRLAPAELARVVAELGRRYGGDGGEALVAVERNNHGSAVLAYLQTAEHYRHMYSQGGQAGWLTTAASKPEIVARMGVLLTESPGRFLSRRLLAECRTYVSGPGGGTGAASGSHDDLVMAMAIAQAVRAELLGRGA